MRFLLFKNAIISGLCFGLAGGILLSVLMTFHGNSPNHPLEIAALVLFIGLIFLSVLSVKIDAVDNKHAKVFLSSYLTFTLIMTALYIYKYLGNGGFDFMWKHFITMEAIGMFLCGLLTFVSGKLIRS